MRVVREDVLGELSSESKYDFAAEPVPWIVWNIYTVYSLNPSATQKDGCQSEAQSAQGTFAQYLTYVQ